MIEIKKDVASRVPVRLFAGSTAESGTAYTDITVRVIKADGATTEYNPSSGDWTIFNTGVALNTGLYQLTLKTTDTSVVGSLTYIVKSSTSDAFVGHVKVVANEEADTYTKVVDLQDEALGKWQVFTTGPDANRLVLYRQDGVTVLKKFDLADANGSPAVVNPFRRTPV